MRAFEQDLSCYMKAKLLNVKEDLLLSSTKVKRLMKLNVGIESAHQQNVWKVKIEGRVLTDSKSETDSVRFLELFEKVRLEFATN